MYFRQASIEKKNFYLNLFDKHKNNIKKAWININLFLGKKTGQSHCKSMTVNGVELTDPFHIANHFNDYFVSLSEKLVKKVPKTNDNSLIYLGLSFSDLFYLYPTTSQEVQKTISGLKTK